MGSFIFLPFRAVLTVKRTESEIRESRMYISRIVSNVIFYLQVWRVLFVSRYVSVVSTFSSIRVSFPVAQISLEIKVERVPVTIFRIYKRF